MGKWPKLAYYWPTDSTISAEDAIKKRENDNRTGDIWCHAECFKLDPKGGNELFARKGPGSPHFWIGTGGFTKVNDCGYEKKKSFNSESYRYSQVFHDLLSWLRSPSFPEEWGVIEVLETNMKDSDIEISHHERGEIGRDKTVIIIVDKNRKRTNYDRDSITIDISRWPDSHIKDFNNHAKRKFIELWDQLDNRPLTSLNNNRKNKSKDYYRSEESQRQRRDEAIAKDIDLLKISTEDYQKLKLVNGFLSDVNNLSKKKRVKEIKQYARVIYGDTLSQVIPQKKYVERKVAEIDMKKILIDELSVASQVFSRNPTMSFTDKYVNFLQTDLIKLRPQYASAGYYHSITDNFIEISEIAGLINKAHTMLFDKSNELFVHVNKEKSFYHEPSTDTRLDTKVGYRLNTNSVEKYFLFSWMRSERIFFDALFGIS